MAGVSRVDVSPQRPECPAYAAGGPSSNTATPTHPDPGFDRAFRCSGACPGCQPFGSLRVVKPFATTRSLLSAVLVVSTACASPPTSLPDGALQLPVSDQAGLYGAAARELGERADGADVNSGLQGVNRFYVLDGPTLEPASVELASGLEPFTEVVLEAIRAGIGGEVIFVDDPADALMLGEHQVPLTTVPGDTRPAAESVEGWIAPPGSVLVLFGVPSPAWGGGFTGGDWPSDAEIAVDLNVALYSSPSMQSSFTPGIEKRDGVWRVAGFRTMGTMPPTGG